MMHTLGFCLFCLFLIFGSTYSTTYSCDSNAPCGCSENSVVANARIVNGEDARRNTWSWAVSLILNSSSLCGGAIIDQSYIVTAAHCIHYGLRPQDIAVHAGSLNIVGGVVIRVSQILVHPYYDSGKHTNDIALLKLDSPLYLSDTDLAKICLPNVVNTSQEYPTPGTSLMTVGWGTLWSHGDISKILQQVTVNAVEADTVYCQKVIKDPSLQLCAGIMPEGGKDTCQGDSGGPLMMFNSDKKWELVGVVSYGVGCARPGLPGVYTRVSSYIEWINNTIIPRVPPTTTYRTPATTPTRAPAPTTTYRTPATPDFDFENSSNSININVCFLISVFIFLFYH